VSFDLLFLFFLTCFIAGICIAAFVDKYGDK
jgi:hypothetical protein